jgi:hypothetical protein
MAEKCLALAGIELLLGICANSLSLPTQKKWLSWRSQSACAQNQKYLE